MTQPHRNAARKIPRAFVMFIQDRPVVRAVAEDPDAGHFTAGIVVHRRTRAKESLDRIRFNRRRTEADQHAFGSRDIFRLDQSKTTQTPRRLTW